MFHHSQLLLVVSTPKLPVLTYVWLSSLSNLSSICIQTSNWLIWLQLVFEILANTLYFEKALTSVFIECLPNSQLTYIWIRNFFFSRRIRTCSFLVSIQSPLPASAMMLFICTATFILACYIIHLSKCPTFVTFRGVTLQWALVQWPCPTCDLQRVLLCLVLCLLVSGRRFLYYSLQ